MRLIDKYILRSFVLNYIILLLVMLLMIVVVSLIVNIDEFIGPRHAPFDGVLSGTLYTIADFYFPNMFLLFVMMGGLATVGAMGFTFTALSRTGELLGMIAGGISLYRVALPVLVAGCILSLLALPMQEWVIPPLAGKLARGPSDAQ
ncbi:MAG: LptF/LptG family permease, partial [Phycisphaerales bacterium]|nr:LptF/LptG family permease [Phycisphaerales bacterium]